MKRDRKEVEGNWMSGKEKEKIWKIKGDRVKHKKKYRKVLENIKREATKLENLS